MYAVVVTGGKQYKVTEGLQFSCELLDVNVNDKISLDVILVGTDDGIISGKDCAKCKVEAVVVEHGKGKKINIFKYKSKKNVRKRQGHRQPYTKLKVTSISVA
jgi:large subunit ribosomal protein L21